MFHRGASLFLFISHRKTNKYGLHYQNSNFLGNELFALIIVRHNL